MAKITIIIRGVALSYHQNDGVWRVLFPFDDDHTIKFFGLSNLGGIPEVSPISSIAGPNRHITISAKNPVSNFGEGNGVATFFDLTDASRHSNGLVPQPGWEDKAVLMSVENAVFSLNELTETDHQVAAANSINTTPLGRIGYSAKLEIEADSITVDVINNGNQNDLVDFPVTFDKDTIVYFDNDCDRVQGLGDETDLQMLYGVVTDAVNPNLEFSITKVQAAVAGTANPGTSGGFPSPTKSGLPCHLSKATIPNNLPTSLPAAL